MSMSVSVYGLIRKSNRPYDEEDGDKLCIGYNL